MNIPMGRVEAHLRSRVQFAIQHLMQAARLSRVVGQIEEQNAGKEYGAFFDEVLGHSSSVVIMSAAGLEAYINELFADRAEVFPKVSSRIIERLWTTHERGSVLTKYDLALELFECPAIDKSGSAFGNVNALLRLRNALVHFHPEWFDERNEHDSLSRVLAGKFALSPWLRDEGAFPRAWATHSGTKWAVLTAVAFIQEFDEKAGRESRLKRFLDRLAP